MSLDRVRVVVTRPEPRNRQLADLLRERGAEPILLPVLEIAELDITDRIRDAVTGFVDHDWVLFTSGNAVDVFARRLHDFYDPVLQKNHQAERIPALFAELSSRTKVAAVGDATAAALSRHSVEVDLVPEDATGAGAAAALGRAPEGGGSVLLPRSDAADEQTIEVLIANGWIPDAVALYGPRTASEAPPAADLVQRGEYDVLTFASGSAVRAFVELIGSPGTDHRRRVVCIGPKTARVAADEGFHVDAVAEDRSDAGLVDAVSSLRAIEGPGR